MEGEKREKGEERRESVCTLVVEWTGSGGGVLLYRTTLYTLGIIWIIQLCRYISNISNRLWRKSEKLTRIAETRTMNPVLLALSRSVKWTIIATSPTMIVTTRQMMAFASREVFTVFRLCVLSRFPNFVPAYQIIPNQLVGVLIRLRRKDWREKGTHIDTKSKGDE